VWNPALRPANRAALLSVVCKPLKRIKSQASLAPRFVWIYSFHPRRPSALCSAGTPPPQYTARLAQLRSWGLRLQLRAPLSPPGWGEGGRGARRAQGTPRSVPRAGSSPGGGEAASPVCGAAPAPHLPAAFTPLWVRAGAAMSSSKAEERPVFSLRLPPRIGSPLE